MLFSGNISALFCRCFVAVPAFGRTVDLRILLRCDGKNPSTGRAFPRQIPLYRGWLRLLVGCPVGDGTRLRTESSLLVAVDELLSALFARPIQTSGNGPFQLVLFPALLAAVSLAGGDSLVNQFFLAVRAYGSVDLVFVPAILTAKFAAFVGCDELFATVFTVLLHGLNEISGIDFISPDRQLISSPGCFRVFAAFGTIFLVSVPWLEGRTADFTDFCFDTYRPQS